MSNIDKDLQEYFKNELSDIEPSKELKTKICNIIEAEDTKKTILSRIRVFINREVEIPIALFVIPIVFIAILPIVCSIYFKDEVSTNKTEKVIEYNINK